jgi:peptide/nickel transport system permease protein
MISEVQTYFAVAPWLGVLPGLAIFLAVAGFYLIGHSLTDLLGTGRA